MITLLDPDQFVKEVKEWGARKDSLHKVRIMKKGELVYLRFCVPHTAEIIETVIKEEDYYNFNFVELSPIAIPAVWKDETDNLKKQIMEVREHAVTAANSANSS